MVKITLKQSLYSKFLFFILPILGRLRLMSLERICKITNRSLRNGAFKMKVGDGKWEKMEIDDYELEVER